MNDWEAILRRGFESKELDYKGPCEWSEGDKKACCELVKDILAIANAKGGFIVIGVSEGPTGYVWSGLDETQCRSFETSRLNRFVQNYTDPPINAHVIKHISQGANFVIIEIPRFPDTPHICQKDYHGVLAAGAVYVRTDNNESAPIKDSSDMRSIVEQAVRNRSDQLISSFRAILTDTQPMLSGASHAEQFDKQIQAAATRCRELIDKDIAGLGYRETVIHPVIFDRLRFSIPDLERMAEAASVTYRGWPYIFYEKVRQDLVTHLEDGLESVVSNGDMFQFWRLHQSGLLYVTELFVEDRPESRSRCVLGTSTTAYYCAEAVMCLVNLFADQLTDDERARLFMRLTGVKGRQLARVYGSSYAPTAFSCEADQVVFDQQHTLADWRAGVIPHAIDILREIHKKFSAPPPSPDEVAPLMQKMLDRQM